MSRATKRRALQVFLTIVGSVALVAGIVTMLLGAGSILGAGVVTPTVDSEMRFYAAWYAAAGVVVLRTVPRVESERTAILAIGAVFFIAGCGRLLSLVVVGRPHPASLLLMVIELVLPFVIVPWQASLRRSSTPATA